MRVQLSVYSLREAEGDRDEIRFTVSGEFVPTAEGGVITYQDPGEGMEGTATTLTAAKNSVTIENKGALNSCLTVEQGKRHMCRYDTGCGVLALEITGEQIQNHLSSHPKTLEFIYTLSIQGGKSRHTLRLELRPTIG